MARGRMLNSSISQSRKYQDLGDDTHRLLATWCLAHLDYNGVMPADPSLFRAMVCPWRIDLSNMDIEEAIEGMVKVQLIVTWEEEGRTWLWFPHFRDNQVGLRPEREAASNCPLPPEWLEDTYGWLPEGRTTDPAYIRGPDDVPDTPPGPKPRRNRSKQNVERPAAVEVFRSVHKRYPRKATWARIESAIGDNEDNLAFWKQVCEKWSLLGWKPDNLDGQIDYFNRRQLPGRAFAAGSNKSGEASGMAALRELQQEVSGG